MLKILGTATEMLNCNQTEQSGSIYVQEDTPLQRQ